MDHKAHYPAALLLAWLILLLPPMGAAQTTDTADVANLHRLAGERYAEGDLQSATQLYLEIAQMETAEGARAQAFVTASWLQHLQQKDLAALDSLTQALTIDPQYPFDASHYNRDFEVLYKRALDEVARRRQRQAAQKVQEGLVAMEAEQDSVARLRLQEALDLTPDSAVAIYNLALLDLRQGAEEQAMTGFERVAALTFNEDSTSAASLRAKAQTSIGIIFFNRSEWQDAEAAFLEATRAHPEDVLAWKSLGLVRLEQDNYPGAVQALQTAIRIEPEDPGLAMDLARALIDSARGPEAVDLLTASLEQHSQNAALWSSLGRAHRQLGSPEQAALAFQRAIEADPGNAEDEASPAAVQIAWIRYQQGSYDAAMESAGQAAQWDPGYAAAWHVLGLAQQAAGDLDAAATSLDQATKLDPTRVDFFLDLGHVLVADNALQPAETAFSRALSLDPESEAAKRNLEIVRGRLVTERAIASGSKAAPRARGKPIPPKKIGLRFVELNYKKLNLRGALVNEVNKKSPAARAGLRKGDLVLWVGQYGLMSDKDFFEYLKRSPPGETLDLQYLRDGKVYQATLELR
ncbi:MAG: tetratricopeptide repeat protein [Thermoanaerobaculia bacterium]